MKKLTSLTSFVSFIGLGIASYGTGSVCAQSTNLPIYSVAALVSHDLIQISSIQGWISCESMLQSNGLNTYFNVSYQPNGIPKRSDIMALIASQPLSMKIANPSNDWISEYVSYSDTNGNQLFSAGNSFNLVRATNGSWQIPAGATNLSAYLGYASPIYESNAIAAQINLRDTNGIFLGEVGLDVYVNSANHVGAIQFQNYYAGQHGETVVTYGQYDQYGNVTNSYQVAFSLDANEGGIITPTLVQENISADFAQLVTLVPPSVWLFTGSYNHVGTPPLVEITVTPNTTQPITFRADAVDSYTGTIEHATGFTVKLLQLGTENEPVQYLIPQGHVSTQETLAPGVYHIDFNVWPTLAPEQAYPPYYYGGGKG